MIRSSGYYLTCDDCGKVDQIPAGNEPRLREVSKALGWRRVDGKDLCKGCIDRTLQERISKGLGPLVYE